MRLSLFLAMLASMSAFGFRQGSSIEPSDVSRLATSDDPDRFKEIVQLMERAKSAEEGQEAVKVLAEAFDILWERGKKLFPRGTEEAYKGFNAYVAPAEPYRPLIFVDPKVAADLASSLFKATSSERVQMIKILAKNAGEDWPLANDDWYLGPTCGSYDHTNERKLKWAVWRFRAEAIQALKQYGWSGKRQLMVNLKDYGIKLEASLQPVLLALARDRNTLVRGQAILSLVDFPGPETEAVIVESLDNAAADTRIKALIAAKSLKIKAAEDKAIKLVGDRVTYVGEHAISYLGVVDTPRAKWKLIECLKDKDLLGSAVEAMKNAKQVEAVPYLIDALPKASLFDRQEILGALADLDPMQAEPEVLRALNEKDEDFLLYMIGLAKSLKLKSARARLMELGSHSDEYIRKYATQALTAIGG